MKRALLLLLLAAAAHAEVPTPSKFLGLDVGADRKLADYRQIVAYFNAVAAASPRVKIEHLGKTTLGEAFVMAVASPEPKMGNPERTQAMATRRTGTPACVSPNIHARRPTPQTATS